MMWNSPHALRADAIHAIRMVLTGQATTEQAAAASGLSVAEIRAILAASPQARLQEFEPTPPMRFGRATRQR